MGKKILTLLFCLVWSYSVAQRPQKVVRLRIAVSEMFAQRDYVITDSTIRVALHELGGQDTLFTRVITPAERSNLLAPLDQMDLASLRNEYQSASTSTDMPAYTFTVVKGSFVKRINLYEYQLRCLSDVSRRLDALLPEAFRLNYVIDAVK